MTADDRLIVALDVPNILHGQELVGQIGDAVTFYKIGLGMLTGGGLALANELKQEQGKRIFLDMKLFDIGATVEAAVRGLAQFDLDFLTVHGDPHVVAAAKEIGLPVRGYVSCVTDCPYDGATPPEKVAEVAKHLFEAGCYEISLGDTIGQGTPESISAMLKAVLAVVPADMVAGHYHDTAGRALANIEASLALGIRVFDAAVGGLGGCPYAPGAKGNVATEAVDARLKALGYETGLNVEILARAAEMARAMRSA